MPDRCNAVPRAGLATGKLRVLAAYDAIAKQFESSAWVGCSATSANRDTLALYARHARSDKLHRTHPAEMIDLVASFTKMDCELVAHHAHDRSEYLEARTCSL